MDPEDTRRQNRGPLAVRSQSYLLLGLAALHIVHCASPSPSESTNTDRLQWDAIQAPKICCLRHSRRGRDSRRLRRDRVFMSKNVAIRITLTLKPTSTANFTPTLDELTGNP